MQIVAQALHTMGTCNTYITFYMFILIGQIQITQINHITSRDPIEVTSTSMPKSLSNTCKKSDTISPHRSLNKIYIIPYLIDGSWMSVF
jgi:hypothetical protein